MKITDLPRILLRGVSQVMLQNNEITGLLFLVGIFYNSWILGLGAIIGVIASTITAYILKYNKEDIGSGLYGFNGTLVGIALLVFFNVNALLIALIILGSILSSLIMNFMHERRLSPFTFPFVLSTWILLILVISTNLLPIQIQEPTIATGIDILSSLTMGFGQVMFQANIITGIVFLIAILVSSRVSAAYAVLGSLLGMVVAVALSFPLSLVNIGVFGFNGVLCGIASADKNKSSLLYAAISIILSVLIIYSMLEFDLIALTAPFVFATWITLGLRKIRA